MDIIETRFFVLYVYVVFELELLGGFFGGGDFWVVIWMREGCMDDDLSWDGGGDFERVL